jgi:hypothetical protein
MLSGRSPSWLAVLIGAILVRTVARPARAAPRPDVSRFPGKPFEPGKGPTTSAWREEAITRANELEGLARWIAAQNHTNEHEDLLKYVRSHLEAVRMTAAGEDEDGKRKRPRLWTRMVTAWRGAAHERTLGNLDAVEANLLRIAPGSFVCGEMPSLQAHVNRFLPNGDPRLLRVTALTTKAETQELTVAERSAVVAALHAANTQRRRDLLRVRSFRNVMFGAAALLVPLAFGLAVFGAIRPDAIPLCFNPVELEKVVCPTEEVEMAAGADIDDVIAQAVHGFDIALIEIIGMIAAVVAGIVALRNVRGTSTPYSLAVSLALVKIPLGALTAVLGLVLMSGGFVPGLSALDTSAQILAWALVFGFSQQLLTRLVDQRAESLLQNVGGRGAAGDRSTS